MNSLFAQCPCLDTVHSDGYKPYIKYMEKNKPGLHHTTSKDKTTHIESFNSVIRDKLACFNRRSFNIAKKVDNLLKLFKLFIYKYIIRKSQ